MSIDIATIELQCRHCGCRCWMPASDQVRACACGSSHYTRTGRYQMPGLPLAETRNRGRYSYSRSSIDLAQEYRLLLPV